MPSLTNRNQTGSTASLPDPATTPPPPAPGGAAAGPTLPLPTALENAAKDFKKLFTDNGASYHLLGGQGALTSVMREKLVAKVWAMSADVLKNELVDLIQGNGYRTMRNALLHSEVRLGEATRKSLPPTDPDSSKLAGVLRTNSIVNTTRTYRETTATARRLMADPAVSAADRAVATEVLDDKAANGQWSWNTLGNWMAAPGLGPVTFDKFSLPRLLALYLNATVQCAPMASSTARKLFRTRGVSPSTVPAFPGRAFAVAIGKGVLRKQDKDDRSTDANLILRYNAAQLDAAVQSARAVLATGYLVAGCLSGMVWDFNDHPFPEHYILLFAADGDVMLFWDPDAGSTNIAEFGNRLGSNIGLLFYDHSDPAKPTLSTGVDFSDLSSLSGGDHAAHRRRHRYQIATLAKPEIS